MENDNTENFDSQNEEVHVDTEETTGTETSEETVETESDVDVAQLQATNKRLFERAKKAESDLKALKSTGQKVPVQKAPSQLNNNPSSPNIEEVVLKAQGVDQEALNYLKKVAAVNGTGLIDAQKDDLFTVWKDKREKEQKSEKARLGASRSSGKTEPKKTFSTPGITKGDHYEMWKEKNGL